MKYFPHYRSLIHIAPVLVLMLLITLQSANASAGTKDLAAKIATLELGMNGYTIGTKLSAEKKNFSSTHLLNDAYAGTYKFSDGDLSVVVAQKDDTVLALYQRNEDAGRDQVKKMVSGLMGQYGVPTAMAHEKLIYWAYNEKGKIAEDEYNKSREKAEKLDVLATVKFNSAFSITNESPEEELKGAIYFIISSDRLTAEFMKNE